MKDALRLAVSRDPVDAAQDAEVLSWLLGRRCRMILNEDGSPKSVGAEQV
jgi:hypothetical protein